MNKKNIGIIKIPFSLIEEEYTTLPEIFYRLIFTPIEVKTSWIYNSFEYKGLSPCFKKIGEGELIPEYSAKITRDGFGKIQNVEVV